MLPDTHGHETVSFYCVVSGSHITRITWHIHDYPLSTDAHEITETQVEGEFSFEQKTATRSTLKLTYHANTKTCREKSLFDGVYKCYATGKLEGQTVREESNPMSFVALCKYS